MNLKNNKIVKYGSILSYLTLYVVVMIVSLISSIDFFQMAHGGWMSVTLAVGFEIGQAACLFGALTRRKEGFDFVWLVFILLTLFQAGANTYSAYIHLHDFGGFSELFDLVELEVITQKRILAIVSGAILPVVALSFVHVLTDYLKELDDNDEVPSDSIVAEEHSGEKSILTEEKPENDEVGVEEKKPRQQRRIKSKNKEKEVAAEKENATKDNSEVKEVSKDNSEAKEALLAAVEELKKLNKK